MGFPNGGSFFYQVKQFTNTGSNSSVCIQINLIIVFYSCNLTKFLFHYYNQILRQSSRPNPWEDVRPKAYAICPWFADTDLLKESSQIKKLEKDTMLRVLTVQDVGNELHEALKTDENGGEYVVFRYVSSLNTPN